MEWIKDNVIHIIFYMVIIAICSGVFYKTFLKDTSKTVYTQPVTQYHELENPKYAPFSCARIEVKK